MVAKIPTVKLNNGKEMPILGLGTWKVNKKRVFFKLSKKKFMKHRGMLNNLSEMCE